MDDIFADIAEYYDELYVKPDQYKREADKAIALVEKYRLSDGNDLLDIACGTGGHIPYWCEHYQVTGMDISPKMLACAAKKFPDVDFQLGDMVDFNLGREFDVITCLYGSIGFVRKLQNLNKALVMFALHLKLGGILYMTPCWTQEEFRPEIVADVVKHPHMSIARMENIKLKRHGMAEVDFHHLLGRDSGVTYHQHSIEMGLFSRKQYHNAISMAKLELMEYYKGKDAPMGVFVARKAI